jgi:hypothetical protein
MIVGCFPQAGDPVIDGWPVGAALPCTPEQKCQELLAAASAGLDRRNPGHADVVEGTLHAEGRTVNASGETILITRSGSCCSVALFTLTDGTVRAIGVGYPGISTTPMAIDFGP